MDAEATVARIVDAGVIAVVRLASGERLLDVAHAVAAGGVTVIEFTMTTPGALDALARATDALGDEVLLGAGTVLDADAAERAMAAGARFVVAPTLRRTTIEACERRSVPMMPGAYSPTEILTATEWGARIVKVFPAATVGPRFLGDILGPLPGLRLVPTGGVDLGNAAAFISAGAAALGVGTSLVDPRLVAAGDLAGLTERARAFRAVVDGARRSAGPES